MKNLLKLGKALNKAEQKEVYGGTIPNNRDECDPGSGSNSGVFLSDRCRCWAQGGYWNEECKRCEFTSDPFLAGPDCFQLPA